MSSTPPLEELSIEPEFITRFLAIVVGALLLQFAFIVTHTVPTVANPVNFVALALLYAASFGLLGAGLIDVDLGSMGRKPAYVVYGVVLFAAYVAYLSRTTGVMFGTDAILFSQYAIDLLLAGQNPYAHSMVPAFERYPVSSEHVTFQNDGTIVTTFSYPAMSILWFLPQALLGIPNLNLTSIVVLLLVVLLLIRETPAHLSLAPIAVVFADPSLVAFSYGGVFDILWVLPLLVSMKFWAAGRWDLAAFVLGIAFATKQTPWFIAPFLAVWIYMSSETLREVVTAGCRCSAFGLAGFLLPNLPFIVWNPSAWVAGVLTPVAGGSVDLVQQGGGITMLGAAGIVTLPKSFYTITMLLVMAVALVAYGLYFDRTKWLAWIVPAIILWFNYRSLQNYFIFFVPIAYYAVLLKLRATKRDRTHGAGISSSATETQTSSELWKPQESLDSRTRRRLLASVSAAAVAGIAATAVAGRAATALDVDLELTAAEDEVGIHRIDQLTFEVTNNESESIEPRFRVFHEGSQTNAYWDVESGPPELPPDEHATYVTSPRSPAFSIPYDAAARLSVNDSGTVRQAQLPIRRFSSPGPTGILNPGFQYWGHDAVTNSTYPYRWSVATSKHGAERLTIGQTVDGDSVQLSVDGVTRDDGPWGMAGIQQDVPFPGTIHIDATPETVTSSATRHPQTAVGMELIDRSYRVWIVFADVAETTIVAREGDLDYAFVYVPAEPGVKTTTSVDISTVYEEMDWELPPERSVSIDGGDPFVQRRAKALCFAAAYPGSAGSAAVSIHRIESEYVGSNYVSAWR